MQQTVLSIVDHLRELENQDTVRLTVDGEEYVGEVSYHHHESAERFDGIPASGSLVVDVELDDDSLDEHGAPSHALKISVTESLPGRWGDPDVKAWDPVVDDDGHIVDERFVELGSLEDVEEVSC